MRARTWLPHPLLSAALVLVWLLLNNSIAAGHLVLGTLFGILLPRVTAVFWPEHPRMRRPGVLVRLIPAVLYDIVVANIVVARLILGSPARLRPAFVRMPLDLQDSFAISLLASIITLTPGTVSADVTPDRRFLLIHALDVADEPSLVAAIKTRYEAPLKEIFGC